MRELVDVLARLEGILTRSGAQVLRIAHPGIDEEELTRTLAPLGLAPTAELTAWFRWHDGSGEDGMPWDLVDLVPGCELNSAAELVAECRMQRQVAIQLGAAGVGLTPEAQWREDWFPLLRLKGKGNVVVDLGHRSGTTPVLIVWSDGRDKDRGRARWSSIAAFVRELVLRFEDGRYTVDDEGVVQGRAVDYW